MAYHSETSPGARLTGFGLVVLLHIAIVYALVTGLAKTAVEVIKGPIQVETLADTQDQSEPPPPPPPAQIKPPPVYVPPVEVQIQVDTASSSAIRAVSSDRTNPKPSTRNTIPDYPDGARKLHQEGSVELMLTISAEGRVTDAKLTKSSGYPELDDAAMKHAVSQWRYKPATVGGQPTETQYPVRITFVCVDRVTKKNQCG